MQRLNSCTAAKPNCGKSTDTSKNTYQQHVYIQFLGHNSESDQGTAFWMHLQPSCWPRNVTDTIQSQRIHSTVSCGTRASNKHIRRANQLILQERRQDLTD